MSAPSGPGRSVQHQHHHQPRTFFSPRRVVLATALLAAAGVALTWPALLSSPPLAASDATILDDDELARVAKAGFGRVVDPSEPWGAAWIHPDADPQLGTLDLSYAGGTPSAEGWLTHWLSMGGEGALTVMVGSRDLHNGPER